MGCVLVVLFGDEQVWCATKTACGAQSPVPSAPFPLLPHDSSALCNFLDLCLHLHASGAVLNFYPVLVPSATQGQPKWGFVTLVRRPDANFQFMNQS